MENKNIIFSNQAWSELGRYLHNADFRTVAVVKDFNLTELFWDELKEYIPRKIKIIEVDGVKYKEYNASTSKKAKLSQIEKYKTGKGKTYAIHVEGVESLVPYKGPVADVLADLMAGVRSGFSYSGALNLEQLWKNARFMRVTQAGLHENNAHNVLVNTN